MQTIQENINVQAIYDLFEEYRNCLLYTSPSPRDS